MSNSIYTSFVSHEKKISLMQGELPELKDGELLVKNTFVTLCRSDIYTYKGVRKEKSPTILGHEISGHIVAFGPHAPEFDNKGNPLKLGDRITWAIYASDPEDPNSKKGFPQKAKNVFKYGHEQLTDQSNFHGGLAQYTLIRKFTPIVKLTNEVSNAVAALINCSIATMAAATRIALDLKDKHVLVCGAGMLGLVGSAMISKTAAASVSTLDNDAKRLKNSKVFGSNYTYSSINDLDRKFDIIIDTSGAPEVMTDSLQYLDIGGQAIWLGAVFPQADLKINAEFIIRNLITIKGLHNYNDLDLIAAVEFIEQHNKEFQFGDLIEGDFNLTSVNEAFDYAVEKNPYRVGIAIS